ncbi:MAG: CBS domain-containing protein [Bacteroidota bacterium]|jgi:CBS domain-containing protein
MTTVRSVLQSKGSDIWSTAPDTLVFDALKVMAEKNVGALLVMEGNQLKGIFSERDYARKVVLKGESSHNIAIQNVMTSGVISVTPDQSIEDCMALMTGKHIRHLPVLENSKLVGLISIGDVVKAIISQHEDTIKQLENYITGAR